MRLDTEISRKITDKSLSLSHNSEARGGFEERVTSRTGLKHKLSENTAAKERINEAGSYRCPEKRVSQVGKPARIDRLRRW